VDKTGESQDRGRVGAVVLAAGQSTRMGQAKQVLPWGKHTVIEQVNSTLIQAGISEIVVVTGAAREQVEARLRTLPVNLVHNPDYSTAEMVTSLQVGIRSLSPAVEALLVVLGDQPGIEAGVVRAVVKAYRAGKSRLVVPSYEKRRGHPWLADQSLWPDLMALREEKTLRDFLNEHADEIEYVNIDSPSILKDVDTPEDYRRQKPKE
jgi:molybdenum cofactor cytidylyltransferase